MLNRYTSPYFLLVYLFLISNLSLSLRTFKSPSSTNTQMNIALCSSGSLHNKKESARITITAIANELQNQGHHVVIITERTPTTNKIEQQNNITIYRPYRSFPGSKIFTYALAIKKIQTQQNLKFDIIHGFSAVPLFSISLYLTKLFTKNAKIIHTLKSYSKSKISTSGTFLLNLMDIITVPTIIYKNKLHNINLEKIRLIHSPIDTNKFHPQSKSSLKKKYHYQNQKILFYYGGMWENKGIHNLIQAMPTILKTHPNTKLLIAPRYRNIPSQQQLVKSLNLNQHIEFLFQDIPIQDYVAMSDIIPLPYINLIGTEGNPSCLLEAMACKTHVVTSDLPELREIANDLIYFTQPNNIPNLAESINTTLTTPNQNMIDAAYHKSREFATPKIAQEFLKIYQ